MRIGGLQKQSLIDYPGQIACVVFLSGCNFACPYCHNPQLARGEAFDGFFSDPDRFHQFLDERRSFLDAVVISGGEPTLHQELPELCANVKSRGYRVKLDTNGSRPAMIRHLIEDALVDYVAMDIKTDPCRYSEGNGLKATPTTLLESIEMIMDAAPAYEFRTTCVRPFVNESVIESIACQIKGAERYFLQRFQRQNLLSPDFFRDIDPTISSEEITRLHALAARWVQHCAVR
jgi:pyruvate formate lyase activating enzyme